MATKKIAVKAVIKEVKGKAGGSSITFGALKFSSGQVEKLVDLAEQKAEVTLTIEPVQENLPGIDQ